MGLKNILTSIAIASSLYACDSEKVILDQLPDLSVDFVSFEREDGADTTKHHFNFDVINNSNYTINIPFSVQAIHHFYHAGKKSDLINVHNFTPPFGPYTRKPVYIVLENGNGLNQYSQDLSIVVDSSNQIEESNEDNNHFIID